MIPCTQRVVFESTLPNLTPARLIVTSVLSNFLCDVGSQTLDRILDVANSELTAHVQALSQYSVTHPNVQIVVVPPLSRTEPSWFNPYLPCFTSYLFDLIAKLGNSQIRYLSPFVAPPSFFCSDGVHLTPDAGGHFIRFIVDGVDQVFPQLESGTVPFILPSAGPSISAPPPSSRLSPPSQINSAQINSAHSGSGSTTSNLALEFGRVTSALHTLTGLTSTIQTDVRTRREQDNLIFARLKEDRDFEFNKNREDRFTVTGLSTPNPPRDPKERKDFYRLQLQELVDKACPDSEPKPRVVDVFVNMRNGQGSPFLEGRMESAASSSLFRVAASKLARDEDPDFASLFIANSVTLATRVRIEILRAISKVINFVYLFDDHRSYWLFLVFD